MKFDFVRSLPRKLICFGLVLAAVNWMPPIVCFAQSVYVNDFDHHTSPGTYTDLDLDLDWNEPVWNDGVTEGRVTIVTGPEAYGGTGSALCVAYPAGEHGTKDTGAQWKFDFDAEYEEIVLEYKLKFGAGFDFVRGGKLPGLAGGSAPTGSTTADGTNGWTGRMMWRTDFQGTSGDPEQLQSEAISYAKYTDSGFDNDGSQEDKLYWLHDNGSRIVINSDRWYSIRQRIKMNTPGVSDGVLQIWLDGVLVHDQQDVLYRTVSDLKIDMLYFSTFFGGGSSWKTSKDEVAYFDDFHIYIPEPAVTINVPADFPTINEAIDAARFGDTVAVHGQITENVVLDKAIFFRGFLDTRITAEDESKPVIQLKSGGAHLKRLELRRGTHGIFVDEGYRNSIIEATIIRYATDAGICAQPGCDGLTLTRNLVIRNFGDGVCVSGCSNMLIERTRSYVNDGIGLSLLSNDDSVIQQNTAVGCGMGFCVSGSALDLMNNKAIRSDVDGFMIGGVDHFLTKNVARDNPGAGITAIGLFQSTLFDNLSYRNGAEGFDLISSDDNLIDDNITRQNGMSGYRFDDADANVVTNNWAFDNQTGFLLTESTNGNTVTSNRAEGHSGGGFDDAGTGNTLSNNIDQGNGS